MLIVESIQTRQTLLLAVSAGIHALHLMEERQDNNHHLVDCCFNLLFIYLAILIAIDWCALATIILVNLVDQLTRPHESPRFDLALCSLVHLQILLFVAITVAVEHAMVPCNSRCIRTCSFASFIAIDKCLHATLVAVDWLVSSNAMFVATGRSSSVLRCIATGSRIVIQRSW